MTQDEISKQLQTRKKKGKDNLNNLKKLRNTQDLTSLNTGKTGKLDIMNKTYYIYMIERIMEEMDTEIINKGPVNKLIILIYIIYKIL